MASRSFKPASYLAQAAQQKPSRSPRPSFARNNSSSSNISAIGEDAFAALRSLDIGEGTTTSSNPRERGKKSGGAGSPRCHTPGTTASGQQQYFDDLPRKRSNPIAIQLPPRSPTCYTPLTGRGDLHEGYFAHFGDAPPPLYKPHPFAPDVPGPSNPGSPSNMSASSSQASFVSDVSLRGPASVLTPSSSTVPIMETLGIPMGKYYPSNYKPPKTSSPYSPGIETLPLPPSNIPNLKMTSANLSIPQTKSPKTKKQKQRHHERTNSDVKRQLQQYQRDMIAQAQSRVASSVSQETLHGLGFKIPKPDSPRILPAGSPGPITPFELEEESAGYIAAGVRARGRSIIGTGLEREREKQTIEEIINAERIEAMETDARRR